MTDMTIVEIKHPNGQKIGEYDPWEKVGEVEFTDYYDLHHDVTLEQTQALCLAAFEYVQKIKSILSNGG